MDFILPVSEVRKKLPGLMKLMKKTEKKVIITKNGKPAAVLITPEELETLEIMADPELMQSLLKGMEDIEQGRFKTHEEVFKGV